MAVLTFSVEEPVPVIDVGVKVLVAPVGNPASVSAITPVKPFTAVVDTVKLAELPALMPADPGDTAIVKFAVEEATTSVTV